MKEILYFYLKGCPFCRQADILLDELINSDPKYADLSIKRIEERENRSIANDYDYYYVPCFFNGKTKIHEGPTSKIALKKTLDSLLDN